MIVLASSTNQQAASNKRISCAQLMEAGSLTGFAQGDNQLKAKVRRVRLSH